MTNLPRFFCRFSQFQYPDSLKIFKLVPPLYTPESLSELVQDDSGISRTVLEFNMV